MAKVFVYELIDPRNDAVFYVGKGKPGRARAHLTEVKRWMRTGSLRGLPSGPNLHKMRVIRQILLAGLVPVVRRVRWFEDHESAFRFEAELIQDYGLDNLTNIYEGGLGGGSCPDEVRQKISRANKGKKRTDLTRRRISAGLRGRPVSEATREKMRAAKLGKSQSPGHVAKVAAANRGRTKHPTVEKVCRECGKSAPHRQRKVSSGKLWVKPRCMDCEYAKHRRYIDTRAALK